MKITLCSAAAVAGLCLASGAFGADEAQPAPMPQPAPTLDVKQLPLAVQATLEREGARVSKVEDQSQNGAKVYEVTVSKDGKNYSLRNNSDGTILTREAAVH